MGVCYHTGHNRRLLHTAQHQSMPRGQAQNAIPLRCGNSCAVMQHGRSHAPHRGRQGKQSVPQWPYTATANLGLRRFGC